LKEFPSEMVQNFWIAIIAFGVALVATIVISLSIETLAGHPDTGRIVPEFDQPFLRELSRPPFRIVCRRDARHVRVVRVWRGERLLELAT
jgi:plasmid stabilization system protein ParE